MKIEVETEFKFEPGQIVYQKTDLHDRYHTPQATMIEQCVLFFELDFSGRYYVMCGKHGVFINEMFLTDKVPEYSQIDEEVGDDARKWLAQFVSGVANL